MARIQLMSNTFTVIPEGHYVFHVDSVEYNENFGKMKVKMTTHDGKKHTENYSLLDANNNYNEPALMAFSWMAKCCMGNEELTDIDPQEIVGKNFEADVTHDVVPNRNDPSKTMTFAKLVNKTVYAPEEATADSAAELDLDALLK